MESSKTCQESANDFALMHLKLARQRRDLNPCPPHAAHVASPSTQPSASMASSVSLAIYAFSGRNSFSVFRALSLHCLSGQVRAIPLRMCPPRTDKEAKNSGQSL
jgi:hypothetical protein